MQEPKYKCSVTAGTDQSVCTSENICAKDSRILSWSIDESHEATLDNWHRQFDMMCWPKAQIGLVSSLFWFGWCLTLLWMPRFGDIYGRKLPVAYVSVVSFVLYLGVLYAPSI